MVNWTEEEFAAYERRFKGGDAPRPSILSDSQARNAAPVASTAGAKKSRTRQVKWTPEQLLERVGMPGRPRVPYEKQRKLQTEKQRQRRAENQEHTRMLRRRWHAKHSEERAEKSREYEAKNPEAAARRRRGWIENNRDHKNSLTRKRKAFIPLSKGGSNWPSNLQLLCPRCNCSKNNKSPAEWARESGVAI